MAFALSSLFPGLHLAFPTEQQQLNQSRLHALQAGQQLSDTQYHAQALQAQLDANTQAANQAIDAWKTQNDQLVSQLQQTQATIVSLQQQLQQAQSQIQALQGQLQQAQATAAQQLQQTQATATQQQQQAASQIQQLNAQISSLQTQQTSDQATIQQLQNQLAAVQANAQSVVAQWQQAYQALLARASQVSAAPAAQASSCPPGYYRTINGLRTLDQIRSELHGAGYPNWQNAGAAELASAYARTAGGSVTSC